MGMLWSVGNLTEAAAVLPALEGMGIAEADASHLEAMCVDIPIIDRLAPSGLVRAWMGDRTCRFSSQIAYFFAARRGRFSVSAPSDSLRHRHRRRWTGRCGRGLCVGERRHVVVLDEQHAPGGQIYKGLSLSSEAYRLFTPPVRH